VEELLHSEQEVEEEGEHKRGEVDEHGLPPVTSNMSFIAINAALIASQLLFGGYHGS